MNSKAHSVHIGIATGQAVKAHQHVKITGIYLALTEGTGGFSLPPLCYDSTIDLEVLAIHEFVSLVLALQVCSGTSDAGENPGGHGICNASRDGALELLLDGILARLGEAETGAVLAVVTDFGVKGQAGR